MNQSYYLLSLGCPKNGVASECMSALLIEAGYSFTDDPSSARYLIVNTCAFIEPAVEEAIGAILDLAGQKGENSFLVVAGVTKKKFSKNFLKWMPFLEPGSSAGLRTR